MNVTSARIDIKVAAGRAERILERYAEPLAALHGGAWPDRLLELAWRRVVDNSAHDSICGCSQDAVVSQVLTRFAEAEQIGRGAARRGDPAAGRRRAAGQRRRRQPVAARPDGCRRAGSRRAAGLGRGRAGAGRRTAGRRRSSSSGPRRSSAGSA